MNGGENSCVLGRSSENSQASRKVRGLFAGGWDEVICYSVQPLSPMDGGDFGVSAHEARPVADHTAVQPWAKCNKWEDAGDPFPTSVTVQLHSPTP